MYWPTPRATHTHVCIQAFFSATYLERRSQIHKASAAHLAETDSTPYPADDLCRHHPLREEMPPLRSCSASEPVPLECGSARENSERSSVRSALVDPHRPTARCRDRVTLPLTYTRPGRPGGRPARASRPAAAASSVCRATELSAAATGTLRCVRVGGESTAELCDACEAHK